MTDLLDVHFEEWPNGWSYRINGYLASESGIATTFRQVIRKIESYQRRAYKAYMKHYPRAKIAK